MALRVTVIGTGYLSVTHAACMAECGFEVLGVDVDATKIAALSAGSVPFYEPELPELLQRHVTSSRLRVTTSMAEAGGRGEVRAPAPLGWPGAALRAGAAGAAAAARHQQSATVHDVDGRGRGVRRRALPLR